MILHKTLVCVSQICLKEKAYIFKGIIFSYQALMDVVLLQKQKGGNFPFVGAGIGRTTGCTCTSILALYMEKLTN